MKVWVGRTDAERIRAWAMAEGHELLADRFQRVLQAPEARAPWRVRRQMGRPVLLHCAYCHLWEAFKKHREALASWVYAAGGLNDDGKPYPPGWVHRHCLDAWRAEGGERFLAQSAKVRRDAFQTFLFGDPDSLHVHCGVLIRPFLPEETELWPHLFDDGEAAINADFGNKRVLALVDGMSADERENLLAAGYRDYDHGYHFVLGWIDAVPSGYEDGERRGDAVVHSFVVTDVPKSLRDMLPERVAGRL